MKHMIMLLVLSLASLAFAQHSEKNEYKEVAQRIFQSMDAKDFSAFKTTIEQAGMIGLGDSHPFWIKMRLGMESMRPSNGWKELVSDYVSDRIFVVTFLYYTNPSFYITLTFQKLDDLWVLTSFDLKDSLQDYSKDWGFLLNKKNSKPSEVVRQPGDG